MVISSLLHFPLLFLINRSLVLSLAKSKYLKRKHCIKNMHSKFSIPGENNIFTEIISKTVFKILQRFKQKISIYKFDYKDLKDRIVFVDTEIYIYIYIYIYIHGKFHKKIHRKEPDRQYYLHIKQVDHPSLINEHLERISLLNRINLIPKKDIRKKSDWIPLVITYNRLLPNITKTIRKSWNIL